jgi:hypothetical protein
MVRYIRGIAVTVLVAGTGLLAQHNRSRRIRVFLRETRSLRTPWLSKPGAKQPDLTRRVCPRE